MQKYFEDLKAELVAMARDNPYVRKALDAQRQYGLTDAETFIALSHYLVSHFETIRLIAAGTATDPLKPFTVATPFVVRDIWAGSQPGEPSPRIQEVRLRGADAVRVQAGADGKLSCSYEAVDYDGCARPNLPGKGGR